MVSEINSHSPGARASSRHSPPTPGAKGAGAARPWIQDLRRTVARVLIWVICRASRSRIHAIAGSIEEWGDNHASSGRERACVVDFYLDTNERPAAAEHRECDGLAR